MKNGQDFMIIAKADLDRMLLGLQPHLQGDPEMTLIFKPCYENILPAVQELLI